MSHPSYFIGSKDLLPKKKKKKKLWNKFFPNLKKFLPLKCQGFSTLPFQMLALLHPPPQSSAPIKFANFSRSKFWSVHETKITCQSQNDDRVSHFAFGRLRKCLINTYCVRINSFVSVLIRNIHVRTDFPEAGAKMNIRSLKANNIRGARGAGKGHRGAARGT